MKTSLPFIFAKCIRASTVSRVAGYLLPPPGWCRYSQYFPSEYRSVSMTPDASSDARRTAAPAASARRMHVPRSVKSVMRESVSAPMQSTVRYFPVWMYWEPIERL